MESLGSFERVVSTFSSQVAELKEMTLMRVEDSTKQLYADDLAAIDTTVYALEVKLRDVHNYLKKERNSLPRMQSLIHSARQQHQHVNHIAAHIPTYVPTTTTTTTTTTSATDAPSKSEAIIHNHHHPQNHLERSTSNIPAAKKQRPPAPRRYITIQELTTVPSYMKGRLTIDKVNAAIDELASKAEHNAQLVSVARRNRPLGAEKRQAFWLMANFAGHDALKNGQYFVVESDLKNGSVVRMDNSGRSMLVLLRHLGRLSEVRVGVEGTTHLVYIMNDQ